MITMTDVVKAQGNLKAITGTQGTFSNRGDMSNLTGLSITNGEKEQFLGALKEAGIDAMPLQSGGGTLIGLQAGGENALVTAFAKLDGEQVKAIKATVPKSREAQQAAPQR